MTIDVARQWLEIAEGDWRTANREFAVESEANYRAVCFFAQQCAEKLMKALLIQAGVLAPRTRDLEELDRALGLLVPARPWLEDDLSLLTAWAVESRYPGVTPSAADAEAALDACSRVRDGLLPLFRN